MRLLLFIAVLALGTDAILYNGAYTQSAWRTVSHEAERLMAEGTANADEAERPAERKG